jgi:hypothetical protein
MSAKERLPVQERPAQEQWYRAETPDQPSIRLRREVGGYEAAFALALSGVAPPGSRGELVELPAMQEGQAIEVVHQAFDGKLHCLVLGRAHARLAENALGSADTLWRNLEVSWGGDIAPYRFIPSDGPSCLTEAHGRWKAVIEPVGLRIPVRQPIGYLATVGSSNGDLILPHPAVRPLPFFNALAESAMAFSAPVEVRLSLRAFSLTDNTRRALQFALQGDGLPEWVEGNAAVLVRAQGQRLLEALRADLEQWCNRPFGYRVTCLVASEEPVPDTVLALIGREIFHGRPVHWTHATQEDQGIRAVRQALDLRNAIPVTGALPPLFPAREVLEQRGVPVQYSKIPPHLPEAGLQLGQVGRVGRERRVCFAAEDRTRHAYVLGATGTGKSTLLYHMIMQDIHEGAGVCLLDPHGDLYQQVIESLPPKRLNDVVLIDPCDFDRAVGLNFLECSGAYPKVQMNFVTNEMIGIFHRLYDLKQTGGPMFETYMRNALLLVMDNEVAGGTLMDVPWLFEDKDYRRFLLDYCRNPYAVNFWRKQAERAGGEASLENMTPYITSKLNQFTSNTLLRPIIGQKQSTTDFTQCMDEGRIVLVNLSKGLLGALDTQLLGMLIIGKLFAAALQRIQRPKAQRRPFFLYVDEAHNFITDTLAHMLAEARKFGLCLTLANQNLAQITGKGEQSNLVDAVLGNVGTLLMFRLGAVDANRMEVYTKPELSARDLQDLPDHHVAARLLVRGHPTHPFVFRTLAPWSRNPANPTEDETVRIIHKMLQANQVSYTRLVAEVEKEIQTRRDRVMANLSAGSPA